MSTKLRIALVLLLLNPLAFAQKPARPETSAAKERAAMIATLRQGKEFEANRTTYRHLPEVLAVERTSLSEAPTTAIARIGVSGGKVIETRGKLVLFRGAQARQPYAERAGETNVYPAVLNTHSGNIGVLTGVLVVRPKAMANAQRIAASHGLEFVKEYKQLGIVLLRVPHQADILDAAAALAGDVRVADAYPEILERLRTPR
jgi:hypothetical protein